MSLTLIRRAKMKLSLVSKVVVMRPPTSPSILPLVPGRVTISKLDPHCTSFIDAVVLRTITIRMPTKKRQRYHDQPLREKNGSGR